MIEIYKINNTEQETLYAVSGKLSFNTLEQARRMIPEMLESAAQTKKLVFDLSRLRFLDSSGVGFFIHMKNSTIASGINFSMKNLNDDIANILKMSRVADYFDIT